MSYHTIDTSQHKAARVAGVGILITFIAIFFVFLIISSIIIGPRGEAATAANNFKNNEWIFGIFIACVLILFTINLVVAIAFYILFRPVKKELSLLLAIIRSINSILFPISIGLFSFETSFNFISIPGVVYFTISTFILGYLIIKSGYIPKILGILLIIGGIFGYLIETITYIFFPNFVWIAYPGLVVAFIAEISLGFWLLLKGLKIPEINPNLDSF